MMDTTGRLLSFCAALEQRRARYDVLVARPDAVMVALAVPGERWEIEFFTDGRIEVERFVSRGLRSELQRWRMWPARRSKRASSMAE
jgi:hypothetical protein